MAQIEQVVRDSGHLPMSPECQNEIGTGRRQHLSVVREDRRIPHLGCSFRGDTGIGILDGDQLHVRHGDKVAEVGGVINCMPMAYLDSGNANGHGCPRRKSASFS